MDFIEYKKLINLIGFDDKYISLNEGAKDGAMTIEWSSNHWSVYYTEGGKKDYIMFFNSINDALKEVFEFLLLESLVFKYRSRIELDDISKTVNFFKNIRFININSILFNNKMQLVNTVLDLKPTLGKIDILMKEGNFEGVIDYLNENQLLPKKSKDYYKAIPLISPIINDETISYYLVWGKEEEVYLTTDNFESFIKVSI